ncbi:MAG: hypothetical protein NC394_08010 [Bacteroides sp.]|nr:hypothetical protein [Bacteroides sp.]
MERLKRLIKRIFCLPPLPTVLAAILGFGFVLAAAVLDVQNRAVAIASYTASAYALVVSLTGLKYIKTAAEKVKQYILGSSPMKKLQASAVGEKFLKDIRFRTGISLYKGFFINLLYIVIKMFSGIYYRSAWFIALAVYYSLLAAMRLMLIRRVNTSDKVTELKRYRLCGLMLLLMNQALAGIVIFMVHRSKGFDYPGILIYAMAMYSFYAVITAVVKVVKTRRHDSPILSAAKAIDLVAAMVSLLSLETAMLARFGENDNPYFRRAMTGATGGAVCTVVVAMAVFMTVKANRQLKNLKINKTET